MSDELTDKLARHVLTPNEKGERLNLSLEMVHLVVAKVLSYHPSDEELREEIVSSLCQCCSSGVCNRERTIEQRLEQCEFIAEKTNRLESLIHLREQAVRKEEQ